MVAVLVVTNSLNAVGNLCCSDGNRHLWKTAGSWEFWVGLSCFFVCVCFLYEHWGHTALLLLLKSDWTCLSIMVCIYVCVWFCDCDSRQVWTVSSVDIFLRHSGFDLGDTCRFPVWFYSPVKKKNVLVFLECLSQLLHTLVKIKLRLWNWGSH